MNKMIKVVSVKALPDYKLLVGFDTQETKIFDFEKYLDFPMFRKLRDKRLFEGAKTNWETVVWDDDTDIAPERLYSDGVPVE